MGLGHQGLAFKKKPTLLSLQVKQPVGRAVGAQRQLGRLGTEVEAWGGQSADCSPSQRPESRLES